MHKSQNTPRDKSANWQQLVSDIKQWGRELGLQKVGISDIDLSAAEARHFDRLAKGYHGEMAYMASHGSKRTRPAELLPGTISIISVRMDYLPAKGADPETVLSNANKAYISRYALGRDYHKVLRKRLQKLATRIQQHIGEFGYRVFTDSAPVLEKPIAEKAGLGWIGKHSNLLAKQTGSWFFLGEIYTDLPLPSDQTDISQTSHCGTCTACIDVCPTRAIVAPYEVDARLCISYLTIELQGPIPIELRPMLGNRIYGCDDCQLFCPWNRFATPSPEVDFLPRHALDNSSLIELFSWDKTTFLNRTEGSPIRRIGHERWLRNIAVALGNAPTDTATLTALHSHQQHDSELLREHVQWALQQHAKR